MRLLAEIAAWWVITFAVWLATVQAVTASELLVGGVCALGCAIPAPWLRRANDGVWSWRWAWLKWLPLMLRQLPGDTWRVWRWGLVERGRTTEGQWVRLELPAEAGPVAATRRAIALTVLGSMPATVVVESDPAQNVLILHRLCDSSDRLDSAVRR